MTATDYEDFIRTAFDYKARTQKNGADADVFRGLERSFAEYTAYLNEDGNLTEPNKNSALALIAYKREAKKVAEFIIGALNRYETSFHLNNSQVEALVEIRKQLSGAMTFPKIETSMESAIDIMKPKLQIHVLADGFLNSRRYTFYVYRDFKEYIHQFGDLEELELKLHEVPFTIIGKYASAPDAITPDGKKLTITVEANMSSIGAPKQFEVLCSIKLRLSGAVEFYREWLRETAKKKAEEEKIEKDELPGGDQAAR